MKICRTCGIEKQLEDFPIQDTKKNTIRRDCRECYNKLRLR